MVSRCFRHQRYEDSHEATNAIRSPIVCLGAFDAGRRSRRRLRRSTSSRGGGGGFPPTLRSGTNQVHLDAPDEFPPAGHFCLVELPGLIRCRPRGLPVANFVRPLHDTFVHSEGVAHLAAARTYFPDPPGSPRKAQGLTFPAKSLRNSNRTTGSTIRASIVILKSTIRL
jgi:hypothetical protein